MLFGVQLETEVHALTCLNRRELVIGSTLATMLGPLKAAHATAPAAGKGGTRHLSLSHRDV